MSQCGDKKMTGAKREKVNQIKKGPIDVIDVSWATGKFVFSLLILFSFY
jgi:hypothetical protein